MLFFIMIVIMIIVIVVIIVIIMIIIIIMTIMTIVIIVIIMIIMIISVFYGVLFQNNLRSSMICCPFSAFFVFSFSFDLPTEVIVSAI